MDIGLKIKTSNKVNIPKMMYASEGKVEAVGDKIDFTEHLWSELIYILGTIIKILTFY